MTLDELAARCEQATGPSDTLDCEIWDAIYPGERAERARRLTEDGPYKGRLVPADHDAYTKPRLAFTASLDAAMTLVPEGAWWELDARGSAIVVVEVTFGDPPEVEYDKRRCKGQATTPVLALVAAALRAKASP